MPRSAETERGLARDGPGYLLRFQTATEAPPTDGAGISHFSSLAVSEVTMRF
jgi:hypothetical protein